MKLKNKIVSAALAAVLSVGTVGGTVTAMTATNITAFAAKGSTLPAPKGLMGSRDYNSIFLSWEKVDGASMYRVYKYNAAKKKYVKYKNVKSTYCYVTGLRENTKYKFKVMTLKKVKGKYVNQGVTRAYTQSTFLGEGTPYYLEEQGTPAPKDYSAISWGDPIPDDLTDAMGIAPDSVEWVEKKGGRFVKISGGLYIGGYFFCIQDWADLKNSLSMEVVDGETWEEYSQRLT